MFAKFLKDESGATAIEYTLLAALIGVALIAAMKGLQGELDKTMQSVEDELKTVNGGS